MSGSLAGRRILVLEDEYFIASEMEHWLTRVGAEVIGPWPSVAEALAVLSGTDAPVHIGVLDINLGHGETAYPVAERMDALGIPFLFATGNNPEADDQRFRGRPRLEKPVTSRALVRAVEELLMA